MFFELLGAAFTLFIIDVLLVRSKTKHWKIVQDDFDYLIARKINRLRDGIATRAFNFKSILKPNVSDEESLSFIRKQRAVFLQELVESSREKIAKRVNETEIFILSS